jgi:hypothetical protein
MTSAVKMLKWVASSLAVAGIVTYAGDYLVAARRMSGPQAANELGSVSIEPTYVIPHKDGRAEIIVGDTSVQPCIHSLFPHFGYTPCWYLNRRQAKPTVMSKWGAAPRLRSAFLAFPSAKAFIGAKRRKQILRCAQDDIFG